MLWVNMMAMTVMGNAVSMAAVQLLVVLGLRLQLWLLIIHSQGAARGRPGLPALGYFKQHSVTALAQPLNQLL
jgi:hypothetical protein